MVEKSRINTFQNSAHDGTCVWCTQVMSQVGLPVPTTSWKLWKEFPWQTDF